MATEVSVAVATDDNVATELESGEDATITSNLGKRAPVSLHASLALDVAVNAVPSVEGIIGMDMIVEIDSYLMIATDLAEDAVAEDASVAVVHSDVMPTASDEQSRAVAATTSGTDEVAR
jgi:hypothetical protein